MTTECKVVITGIPNFPVVNIRSGPGTNYDKVFQAMVGTGDAVVLDIQQDEEKSQRKNKVFNWFKLRFPNGMEGWCRDDLLEMVSGDWTAFGYGLLKTQTNGFRLIRQFVVTPTDMTHGTTTTTTTVTTSQPTGSASDFMNAASAAAPATQDKPVVSGTAAMPSTATAPEGCQAFPSQDSNMRSGPSTNYNPPLVRVPAGTALPVLSIVPEEGGGAFKWVQVSYQNFTGYIRQDLMTYKGDCGAFGLATSAADLFSAPMQSYTFVRGFTGEQPNHPGWDLGAPVGTAMFSGPVEGYVWRAHRCSKCTPDKPSVKNHGIAIGDTSVFFDETWGWGNGHHVIVRYENKNLPASTQQTLASQGLSGWHLYVTYAHMNTFSVSQGQTIAANTPIGTCGNTGNSDGSHLHLEVRAFQTLTNGPTGYSQMKLLDPVVLYLR